MRVKFKTLTAGLLLTASLAYADTNFVTVKSEIVTNQFDAYAQVEPVALLPVRVATSGRVRGLKIVPGTKVQAGQKLADLGGPEVRALFTHDEAAVSSARTNLLAAQKTLAIQRQQLNSHLSTRQLVLQSQSAVAQAQAKLDTARAELRNLRKTIVLKAPADATVLAVHAADGERVSAGETILTLQPTNQLWIKAAFFGNDAAAIHAGMTGQFTPADGRTPIPVKVVSVFSAMNPDGGQSVGLLAEVPSPEWLNGEAGKVTLNGAARSLVSVPTRALILDQGKWWVLLHTDQGDRHQAVKPGPARGWQTFIECGLKPGDQVVVENAYLKFHRSISENYQPPD